MRLILVGCEYSGTTTLANSIVEWAARTFGGEHNFHDHQKIPHVSHGPLTEDEIQQFLALSPSLKEMFQRFQMEYHLQPSFYEQADHNMVGFHIDEAIYAPLYYGYDKEGERTRMARGIEAQMLKIAPDTTLVLVKASPEVIARRKKESPHPHDLVQEKDIEYVLGRFDEEYANCWLRRKITVDTSTATVEESLAQFVNGMMPYLTEADRMRMLIHRAQRQDG